MFVVCYKRLRKIFKLLHCLERLLSLNVSLHFFLFCRVSPAHGPKRSSGRTRGFPLTQLPGRIETIPPPQKFRNKDFSAGDVNGLPDPVNSATQTTLVSVFAISI